MPINQHFGAEVLQKAITYKPYFIAETTHIEPTMMIGIISIELEYWIVPESDSNE